MRSARLHGLFAASLLLLVFNIPVLHIAASSYPSLIGQESPNSQSEVARLAAQLRSNDEEERREAAMGLSSIKNDQALTALTNALTDNSPRVRAAVVDALSERGSDSVALLLVARLAEDKEQFVRKAAAYALAKFRSSERTAALIKALNDKDVEVRGAAAVSLGDHADTNAVAPLSDALADKMPFVRAQAARALGVNGSAAAQAVSRLISLLTSDPDGEVKRRAAVALGRIGDRSALPALERARRDKDPYLAESASDALKQIRRDN